MKYLIGIILSLIVYKPVWAQHANLQETLKALAAETDLIALASKLKNFENSLSEEDLIVAVNYYDRKQMTQKADSLVNVAIQRFPQGDFAFSKDMSAFRKTETYDSTLILFDAMLVNYPARNLDMPHGILAAEAAKHKDYHTMKDAFISIKDTASAHYFISQIAEVLLKDTATLDLGAEAFLDHILEEFKLGLINEMIQEKAPEMTLRDLNGNTVSLAALRGKTIILDFWATWCGPCVQSFPGMQNVVDHYKNDDSVAFYFINTAERGEGDHTERVQKFIADKGYTFDVLLDIKHDRNDFIALKAFQITGLPTKILIDKNGYIRFKSTGGGSNVAFLEKEIKMMIDLAK